MRDTGLSERWADVNPNGGGISLGHPLGATGARVTATLVGELERRNERYGIGCMWSGLGPASGGGARPLPAPVDRNAISAHSSSRRPAVDPRDLAILYAAVWQAVFAV